MAASTVMENYKSKRACPCCSQKKLVSNDTEKWSRNSGNVEGGMFHSCLNCGYEFFDTKQLRDYRDGEKKDDDKAPWNDAVLVMFAMLAVIMVIRVDRQQDGFVETSGPQTQLHQLVADARTV